MSSYSQYYSTPWLYQVSGLYYNVSHVGFLKKLYLPQVELHAHSTILSTTSRTVLTQTFVNPCDTKGIKKVRYTFPLYEGVSVVGFACHIGDRSIVGEVKEKEKANEVFEEAASRGNTAGLFEQLPDAADVFMTTIGNVPPGARVIIKITYLGELKHDMEVNGIRFTIPATICPRYGNYPSGLTSNSAIAARGSGISIIVDAEMAEGSFIEKVQSPSHPIAVSMGTNSFAPNANPTMSKASATLSIGSAQFDTDFVLQIVVKDPGVPKAILETHPTIANHRALMATLVPKFSLPSEKPEVVFVCDRSGSMDGSRIALVVQALKVFLKSLPVGVKFNICSFGSYHSFLWPKSAKYSQQTLEEAVRHIEHFRADYGGTEMLPPLKSTIEQRYKDIPLDVMVLTDGEIWEQQVLFDYLNKEVIESASPIRVFSLGVGNGVSHSLIEGIARAGNGFSQAVGEGEKMDSKVVRMLKGALSPHVNDYSLEVKYGGESPSVEAEDDFEIIEKVADSLQVRLELEEKKEEIVRFRSQTTHALFTDYHQKKPISLFDTSVNPDEENPPAYDETGESRYAHLPKIPVPKIIQAPQQIPSLFAFYRTSVYLLLGPGAPQATPKSVILRGTSIHGPLELEIPIQVLDTPGETIHQLAAKKAISELEQGRGWLPEAKDESDKRLKEKYESRFDDMVEREAVRLGIQFQVGGKWCSFVAVEKEANKPPQENTEDDYEWLDIKSRPKKADTSPQSYTNPYIGSNTGPSRSAYSATSADRRRRDSGKLARLNVPEYARRPSPPAPSSARKSKCRGDFFGEVPSAPALPLCRSASKDRWQPRAAPACSNVSGVQSYGSSAHAPTADVSEALLEQYKQEMDFAACLPMPTNSDALDALVALQTYVGYWEWKPDLFAAMGLLQAKAESIAGEWDKRMVATALAIAFFEVKLADMKETWELVVEKAREWMGPDADALVEKAKGLVSELPDRDIDMDL